MTEILSTLAKAFIAVFVVSVALAIVLYFPISFLFEGLGHAAPSFKFVVALYFTLMSTVLFLAKAVVAVTNGRV